MLGTDKTPKIAGNQPPKTKRAPRGIQPKTQAKKNRAAVEARRKTIINALLDGKSTLQAGIEAGLSPKSADAQVSQILNPTTIHRMQPSTQPVFVSCERDTPDGSSSVSMRQAQ